MTTTGRSERAAPTSARPAWALLAAIVVVALNLRPAIAAIPPVLDLIRTELGLSAALAGLLTALPVLCMGAFAPAGAALARRVGREGAIAYALGLTALGALVRGLPSHEAVLFAGNFIAGVGIAIGGALLPGVVKAYFPERAAAVTGLYTAGLVGGAMLAAALTVPFMDAFGTSWSVAIAAWGVVALAALLAWVVVTRPVRQAPGDAGERHPLPWTSGLAWRATLYFGSQSLLYYASLTWLSPLYVRLGWSAGRAGLLLGVFSATQLVSALVVPALAERGGDHRPWIALTVGTTTAMLVALALAPTAAPWVWSAVLGLGVGGNFALALALFVTLTRSPAAAASLSGMGLLVGYLLAAVGPVLAGALYDAVGEYRIPFLVLAGVGVLSLAVGTSIRPGLKL